MEAIGRLIKESECVLIYVCEKYRMDERNQAEASFACRLNKPIIVLSLAENFPPMSGWLGDIIRNKVNVKFTDKDCSNESIQELVSHLNNFRSVEKWTPSDVSEWFDSNEIHPCITKLYGVFDGFTLKQIYNMKNLTPEFYYQALGKETNHEITTKDIAYFSQKLESLFGSCKPT